MLPENFHFADPLWLYLVAFLPLVPLAFFVSARLKPSTLFLGNPRLVAAAPGFFSGVWLPWILRLLVLLLCIVATARPQSGQKQVEQKKQVTDLFVAFDVSTSMLTDDLKPNRVMAAKRLLSEFLDKVQDVRVGLTVFARVSFTQCPLTTDLQVVKQLLANVDVFSVKLDGTAIGDALVSSLNRLEEGVGKTSGTGEEAKPSLLGRLLPSATPILGTQVKDTQAILLLTDGGNNAGIVDPLTAARICASKGVKVYTIGVGGNGSTTLFYKGRTISTADPYGNTPPDDGVDKVLLSEIARITGGKVYFAQNNQALENVLKDIAQLQKRDVSTVTSWQYEDLGCWFLLAAFGVLLFDLVLETTVLRTLP
jgi:Ca-activated chloride channel family protein